MFFFASPIQVKFFSETKKGIPTLFWVAPTSKEIKTKNI